MTDRTAQDLVDRALLLIGATAVRPSVTGSTHTTDSLIDRVFKKLMVLGDGDTATAEEHDNLQAIIGPLVTSLSQRGVVNIANINAIAEHYFEPLADVIAWSYAADRGKAGDQNLMARAQKGEIDLKTMTRIARADDMVEGIIEDLNDRRIIYLPDSDAITTSLFEPLARVVAINISPIFEKPFDTGALESAEALLKRKIASEPTFEQQVSSYF